MNISKAIVLLLIPFLFSCTAATSYTINGVIPSQKLDGKTVYLSKYIGRELINIDSAIVKNGEFSFEGAQDTAVLRVLRIDAENINKLPFILENGEIYASLDSVSTAEGTSLNDTLVAYKKAIAGFETRLEPISAKIEKLSAETPIKDTLIAKLTEESKRVEHEMESVALSFIARNNDNVAGANIFWQYRGTFTPELQKTILDKAGVLFKADPFVQIIAKRIEMMKNVLVGLKYTDLTMKSPDGKTVSISDYAGKGKVVLIEFWASWCPSCRQLMPSLVKTYSKYKSKNFEIVGISLDKTNDDWKTGISELGITWPQMSDLKFWSSKGVELYAVRGIPHTVLLDKQGIIVAKDLEPKDLEKKLDELLAEK